MVKITIVIWDCPDCGIVDKEIVVDSWDKAIDVIKDNINSVFTYEITE